MVDYLFCRLGVTLLINGAVADTIENMGIAQRITLTLITYCIIAYACFLAFQTANKDKETDLRIEASKRQEEEAERVQWSQS